jgi:ATP-dependent exoDNAse (exonuclease V) beta subunit
LNATPPFGVRRGDLVVKDVPRNVVADGRSNYDRWQLARHEAREAGSRPSLVVATVKELTDPEWAARSATNAVGPQLFSRPPLLSDRSTPFADVSIVDVTVAGDARSGSGGAAFGTLVHAVLAQSPFGATRQMLERIAAIEATVLGLSVIDAAVAATIAARVFGHDLLQRAGRAAARGACRRETPVTLTLPDGTLVEGVVDLAFEEDGRWVAVDYKTDRELADAEEPYRRQLALYASALAAATGQPAVGVLVKA